MTDWYDDEGEWGRSQDWVYALVDGYVIRITKQIVVFQTRGGALPIPLSQIKEFTMKFGGDRKDQPSLGESVTHIKIPRWLAEDRDLEYDE